MTCTTLSPSFHGATVAVQKTFGFRLITETDKLLNFPELGRVVPEYRLPIIREIIVRSYRVIYRVDHQRKLIEIARVWHAARGTPEL